MKRQVNNVGRVWMKMQYPWRTNAHSNYRIGSLVQEKESKTWRWLFKWNRVNPLTPIVRIIAFGVASARRAKVESVQS